MNKDEMQAALTKLSEASVITGNEFCKWSGHLYNAYGVCIRYRCYHYEPVSAQFPEGTPEYEAYAAELRAALAKMTEGAK